MFSIPESTCKFHLFFSEKFNIVHLTRVKELQNTITQSQSNILL
jgi:hypothetical protein